MRDCPVPVESAPQRFLRTLKGEEGGKESFRSLLRESLSHPICDTVGEALLGRMSWYAVKYPTPDAFERKLHELSDQQERLARSGFFPRLIKEIFSNIGIGFSSQEEQEKIAKEREEIQRLDGLKRSMERYGNNSTDYNYRQYLYELLRCSLDDLQGGSVSRREFLKILCYTGVSLVLGACGSSKSQNTVPGTSHLPETTSRKDIFSPLFQTNVPEQFPTTHAMTDTVSNGEQPLSDDSSESLPPEEKTQQPEATQPAMTEQKLEELEAIEKRKRELLSLIEESESLIRKYKKEFLLDELRLEYSKPFDEIDPCIANVSAKNGNIPDFSLCQELQDAKKLSTYHERYLAIVRSLSIQQPSIYWIDKGSLRVTLSTLHQYLENIKEHYSQLEKISSSIDPDLDARIRAIKSNLDEGEAFMKKIDEIESNKNRYRYPVEGHPRYVLGEYWCNIYATDFIAAMAEVFGLENLPVSHRVDEKQKPVRFGGRELNASETLKWLKDHGNDHGFTEVTDLTEDEKKALLRKGYVFYGGKVEGHNWIIFGVPGVDAVVTQASRHILLEKTGSRLRSSTYPHFAFKPPLNISSDR